MCLYHSTVISYQARKGLLKQKNAIKLQAAVRGHLVRRHAVGTLRCIQAIVKMQTLVRKRRTCLLEDGSGTSENQREDIGKSTLNPMLLVTFNYCSHIQLSALIPNFPFDNDTLVLSYILSLLHSKLLHLCIDIIFI